MTHPLPQSGGSYTVDADGKLAPTAPAPAPKPPKPSGKTPAKGA